MPPPWRDTEPSLDGYRRRGGPADRPPARPVEPVDARFADRADERSGPIDRPARRDRHDRRDVPDRRERLEQRDQRDRPEPPGREVVLASDRRPAEPLRRGRRDQTDDRLPELAPPRRDLVLARPASEALPERLAPDGDPEDGDQEEDDLDDDRVERSFLAAWISFLVQILVAAAGGLAVWLGFQTLWRRWPYGAAAAAAVVLVIMLVSGHQIHRRRHPDEPPDMVTAGVLVIVGLVLTISPVAFVLRPI